MKSLVLIYHDESIFSNNKGQLWMWASYDTPVIQPKTMGSGIIVSDYIDQHAGLLHLIDEEHALATAKAARELLEYGADKEGYWTREKSMPNVQKAARIAEFKYKPDKHTILWFFDHSICHRAFADDAMKKSWKPGGAQPSIAWHSAGKIQKTVFENGVPKGMKRTRN